MTDDSVRATRAQWDAEDFTKLLWFMVCGTEALWGLGLAAMAYFGASIQWIFIVGLLAATTTVSWLVININRRLDAGRAYLENACYEIEKRVIAINIKVHE